MRKQSFWGKNQSTTTKNLQHGNKKFENSNNSKPSLRVQFNADDIATHAGQFLKRFYQKTCEKENIKLFFFSILTPDFVFDDIQATTTFFYPPEDQKKTRPKTDLFRKKTPEKTKKKINKKKVFI